MGSIRKYLPEWERGVRTGNGKHRSNGLTVSRAF